MEQLIFILVVLSLVLKNFEVIDKNELNDSLKVYTSYKAMLSYSLKCRKNTESENRKFGEKRRIILSSKCMVRDSKTSIFIKKQKISGSFEDLGTYFDASGKRIGNTLADKHLNSLFK